MATIENTTFTFSIKNFDVSPSYNGLTNVVTRVHWGYTGLYIDNSGKSWSQLVYGVSDISAPDPMSFTPFEELTFDIVNNWLNQILNISDLQYNITVLINDRINPPTVTMDVPW